MPEPPVPASVQETAAQSRSAYLPVLPDGWAYTVLLTGPGDQSVTVQPSAARTLADQGEVTVVVSGDGTMKRFDAASLKDGVRSAVTATKALRAISEHEEKAAAAKRALLATIGADAASEPQTLTVASRAKAADVEATEVKSGGKAGA